MDKVSCMSLLTFTCPEILVDGVAHITATVIAVLLVPTVLLMTAFVEGHIIALINVLHEKMHTCTSM